jgi:nucleoside-diphosphate-sugar epimerase
MLVAMLESQHNELLSNIDASANSILAENKRNFDFLQADVRRKFNLLKESTSIRCKKSIDMVINWAAKTAEDNQMPSVRCPNDSAEANANHGVHVSDSQGKHIVLAGTFLWAV